MAPTDSVAGHLWRTQGVCVADVELEVLQSAGGQARPLLHTNASLMRQNLVASLSLSTNSGYSARHAGSINDCKASLPVQSPGGAGWQGWGMPAEPAGPAPLRAAPLQSAPAACTWGSLGCAPQVDGAHLSAAACQRGGRCRSCGRGQEGGWMCEHWQTLRPEAGAAYQSLSSQRCTCLQNTWLQAVPTGSV